MRWILAWSLVYCSALEPKLSHRNPAAAIMDSGDTNYARWHTSQNALVEMLAEDGNLTQLVKEAPQHQAELDAAKHNTDRALAQAKVVAEARKKIDEIDNAIAQLEAQKKELMGNKATLAGVENKLDQAEQATEEKMAEGEDGR